MIKLEGRGSLRGPRHYAASVLSVTDGSHQLAQNARLIRRHKKRRAIEGNDRYLAVFGLHRLEHLGNEIWPRSLARREARRRISGANRVVQLDREPAHRIEQPL